MRQASQQMHPVLSKLLRGEALDSLSFRAVGSPYRATITATPDEVIASFSGLPSEKIRVLVFAVDRYIRGNEDGQARVVLNRVELPRFMPESAGLLLFVEKGGKVVEFVPANPPS